MSAPQTIRPQKWGPQFSEFAMYFLVMAGGIKHIFLFEKEKKRQFMYEKLLII